MFSATAASKSKSGAVGEACCCVMGANARLSHTPGATTRVGGLGATRVFIQSNNVDRHRISPKPDEGGMPSAPPLAEGERVVAEARGVVLGWQPRTIVIWWTPGVVFIALAWLETRSMVVTLGLAFFCLALFAFYAFDREVQPRRSRKRYVLTDQRPLLRA